MPEDHRDAPAPAVDPVMPGPPLFRSAADAPPEPAVDDLRAALLNMAAGRPDNDSGPVFLAPRPAGPTRSARKAKEPASLFILALEGGPYDEELASLRTWVEDLLLPVYGREVSATRPWCPRWSEHDEAVARLHALWLAWQQFGNPDAGLAGPAIWHRDWLDPALLQLRAPDGPFAACTTNPHRPAHRSLPHPGTVPATGDAP